MKKILPIARVSCPSAMSPVKLFSSLPSLARTREMTSLPADPETHRSAPSNSMNSGLSMLSVVTCIESVAWVVQNCRIAARRLPLFNTPSTARETKAAIWRRVTLAAGRRSSPSIPVVIPR